MKERESERVKEGSDGKMGRVSVGGKDSKTEVWSGFTLLEHKAVPIQKYGSDSDPNI